MVIIGILWISGILALLVAALLWIPGDLYLKWRKPWGGSLVIWLQMGWLNAVFEVQARRYRWHWWYWQGSQAWHGDPSVVINVGTIKRLMMAKPTDPPLDQLFRRLRAEGWLEIGLRDPALTGQWIGYLGGLPPPLASRIRLRFDQVGWRSRGWIRTRLTPYQLIRILWKTWRLQQSIIRKMKRY